MGRWRVLVLVMAVLAARSVTGAPAVEAAPPRCLGTPATVVGTPGDDVLRGTSRADVIAGLGGDDRVFGLGGADLICGGEGDDLLTGGPGEDRLLGGPGNDRLLGGPGNDRLLDRAGYDSLDGGRGNDTCLNGEATRNCEDEGGGSPGKVGTGAICKTPASPPFVFGAGVPLDEQEQIREGIAIGAGYVRSRIGVGVKSLTVFSSADLDEIVRAYTRWYCIRPEGAEVIRGRFKNSLTAWGGAGVIFVYTGSRGWTQSSAPLRFKIMAHEYFHVVQAELFPQELGVLPDQVRAAGPAWLVEGSAEYVGFRAIDHAGLQDFALARAEAERAARSSSVPLESMESWLGFAAARFPHPVALAAVDLLTATSGEPSLVAFWDAIGRGETWQRAFQTVFGRSVDTFYDQFDAARTGRQIKQEGSAG